LVIYHFPFSIYHFGKTFASYTPSQYEKMINGKWKMIYDQ